MARPSKDSVRGRVRLTDLRLLVRQIRYHNKLYWRTPVATFFTMVLPLFLLLVLVTVLGDDPAILIGMPPAQFYAPSLAVFGAVSACYMYLAVMTSIQRDEGILKRLRGTPLPTWIFLAGRMVSTAWLAFLSVLLLLGVGHFAYGIEIIPERLPAAALTLLVGIFTFSALGMTLAALAGNGETAQAVSNATLLPLAFISDVFMLPLGNMPDWLERVADVFPLKHFAVAFARAFDPRYAGDGFLWSGGANEYAILPHLAILILWGLAGLAAATRLFRWGASDRRRSSFSIWILGR